MGRRLATAALLLASLAGALLLGEAGLRWLGGPSFDADGAFAFRWMTYDPVLSWRNVPGRWTRRYFVDGRPMLQELRIDSLGLRGDEVAERKAARVTRVVCMGDSTTFGIINNPAPGRSASRMVPIASYPGELSRRLEREAPGRYEVLNAGVIGYSSAHGLRQLVVQLLDLEPDVLTLRFGLNDTQPAWAPWHRSLEPDDALRRALLYAFADWQLTRLVLGGYRSLRFLHPEPESVPWTTVPRFRRNLERVAEIARARGIRVWLLDYPLAPPAAGDDPRRPLRRALAEREGVARAVAREQGIGFLETASRFARHEPPPFDAADIVHPNPEGAALLAGLIAEALESPEGALP